MGGKKSFKDRNIVIVCEGSTTEYNYILEVCDYAKALGKLPFTNFVILPANEKPISRNPNRKKQRRHLMGDKDEYTYYSKKDTCENYEKYRGQPTRYLREAQLFIEEDGYVEGWAIYDKDKHTDHSGAAELLGNDSRLNVAFSSYSFEEWLLCHFERNLTPFAKSDCCDDADRSCMCGCDNSEANNCNGAICIAGRLRKQRFIPDFVKTKTDLFKTYSLTREGILSELPLVNAAWMRHKQKGHCRFESNPYTDVDMLLLRLLDDPRSFKWVAAGEALQLPIGEIAISKKDKIIEIANICGRSVLLPKNCMKKYATETDMQIVPFGPFVLAPTEAVAVEVGDASCIRLDIQSNSYFIEV